MVEKRIKLLQYDKKIHLPGEDHTRLSPLFPTNSLYLSVVVVQ